MSQDKSKKDFKSFLKGMVKKAKEENKKNGQDPVFLKQAQALEQTVVVLRFGLTLMDQFIELLEKASKGNLVLLVDSPGALRATVYTTFLNQLIPRFAKIGYSDIIKDDAEFNNQRLTQEEDFTRIQELKNAAEKLMVFANVKKDYIDLDPSKMDDERDLRVLHRNIVSFWTNNATNFIWRFTRRKVVYPEFSNASAANNRIVSLLSMCDEVYMPTLKNSFLKPSMPGTGMLALDIICLLRTINGMPALDTKAFDNHQMARTTARVVCELITFEQACVVMIDIIKNIREFYVQAINDAPELVENFIEAGVAFTRKKNDEK